MLEHPNNTPHIIRTMYKMLEKERKRDIKTYCFEKESCTICEIELDIEDAFFENWCDRCCNTQGYDIEIYDWSNIK